MGLIQTFKESTVVKAVSNSEVYDIVLQILTQVEQELFRYAHRNLLQCGDYLRKCHGILVTVQ